LDFRNRNRLGFGVRYLRSDDFESSNRDELIDCLFGQAAECDLIFEVKTQAELLNKRSLLLKSLSAL